ncbi:MAG TPA: NADPH-dependent glutamate synthase [archaeon]|nr:NADPH-dependent glutamate synthase [archaeon]
MARILSKSTIAPNTISMELLAPKIARKRKAGQFVILRAREAAERIPLTIAKSDIEKGSITVIFQMLGHSTMELGQLPEGQEVADVVGPLGRPTHIENFGTVVSVGGGIGTAVALPIAQAMQQAGNRVIGIVGARTRDLLILEQEMRGVCEELLVSTDDGTYGIHGFVTHVLDSVIKRNEKIDLVLAIGPVPMMRAVCDLTRPVGIKTMVSLNPIMIDGTGMCGGCRVSISGKTKFCCVDGPEFDGHEVDWNLLVSRQRIYLDQEKRALELFPELHPESGEPCKLESLAMAAPSEPEEFSPEPSFSDIKDKKPWEIPRQPMPEQDPKERIKNFREVPYGYTPAQAIAEAQRCMQCKKAPCLTGRVNKETGEMEVGCPVEIDIPGFIKLIAEGDFLGAARKMREKNLLPAICGRVCPQEEQCEKFCTLGVRGEPIAIGRLERFVADYERDSGKIEIPEKAQPTGKKVAVIGSGPAGLTVAGDLILLGHEVTVFEALHRGGGVLVYGIPEFRLPKEIVRQEIDFLEKLGVRFEYNSIIGKLETIDELLGNGGYDAVFVGSGAGAPSFLGIPGENLNGVLSANEYLTRSNLMKAFDPNYDTPIVKSRNVAVVGGGNVAMDSARTALRLGAENVYIVYRRSRKEMPARIEEIHHAEEEGVQLKLLCNPVSIIDNGNGWVKGMQCLRMELGEPDDSGRRRPIPVKGSEFVINVDTVIIAIGNAPNPLIPQSAPDLNTGRHGTITADPKTGATSKPGVFAGGDIVTGAATVILAMGAGRIAARAIHEYLDGK